MDARKKLLYEVQAISELLPELSYYQLLQLAPASPQSAIEPAYRAQAKRLHPDNYTAFGGDDARQQSTAIYRALTEAYRTLRDPEARAAYDRELEAGGRRLSADGRLGAAASAAAAADPDTAARTDKGGKYWRMAMSNWAVKNYQGCILNIQFALNYEPDNLVFKEWLAKTEQAVEDAKSETDHNPYKLRIV